jgi:hypothetical protein
MEPGTLVRHRARPEWGLGVVVAHGPGEKVQVAFEHRELVKLDFAIATAKLEVVDRGAVPAGSPLLDPSRWPELSLAPEKRPASEADTRDLPRELMREVLWTFIGPRIERLDVFCAEVRQYHLDIAHTDEAWRPDEVVLARPRVQVLYRCWRGQRQVEPVVKIAAQDGVRFTAGELLWRVHNAVRHDLHDMDRHFFEGFTYLEPGTPGDGPVYSIRLGS